MTTILTKKFTKLRKELQYLQSELEYVQEILKEWHLKFEEYHRAYCKEKDIDLFSLNHKNSKKVNTLISQPLKQEIKKALNKNKKSKTLKKLYKQLAKKIHPDVGGNEEDFKEAINALDENNYEKLLDICEKHVILIEINNEMVELLKEQISKTKEKIKEEKSTYSWSLYSCEENEECMQNVIRKFLKHLFNYEEKQ